MPIGFGYQAVVEQRLCNESWVLCFTLPL